MNKAVKLLDKLAKLRREEIRAHGMYHRTHGIGLRAQKAHSRYLAKSEQADAVEAELRALLQSETRVTKGGVVLRRTEVVDMHATGLLMQSK